jgi:hypothetical protein
MTWGNWTKVNLPELKKRKLGPKTIDCIFLGYAHNNTTYRFLVIKSDTPEQNVNTIMESRDASFFEDIFPMRAADNTSLSENNHTHMYDPKNLSPPPESLDEDCRYPVDRVFLHTSFKSRQGEGRASVHCHMS